MPKSKSATAQSYDGQLHALHVELVKMQRHLIANQIRLCVVIEGRDGAGKDGTIKRLTEHLSPRETRVVALPKPSDRDRTSWYFQRYAAHLPAGGEFVIFNRSWYNRAGVEPVMGFCTPEQTRVFLKEAPVFEQMLLNEGIRLVKYYLDISKREQRERLAERRRDPLKQWKISPIDAAATAKWADYSAARNAMLSATNHPAAPWHVVLADDKKAARLTVIRHLLSLFNFRNRNEALCIPDPDQVFAFADELQHRLAK
ncbi:MAG TPA: polyphosphate kinase 2 [Alphaproteobacteria bacterium]|nr:polyphosphate kinase 2 [Alphaproteobacteria bacterium]HAJ48420.1 polyphosphate kinase 2 [Alphaproteobacteria bacterium]